MSGKTLWSIVLASFMTVIAFPPGSSVGSARQGYGTRYACVYIDSDPVGAHVYGEEGDDWGQTTEKKWATRIFSAPNPDGTHRPADRKYTITLKKPGYSTTYHTFVIRYLYNSKEAACEKENRQEITVVLDQ